MVIRRKMPDKEPLAVPRHKLPEFQQQQSLLSRGIDVDDLAFVINYEIPNIPETYVHRIGRTGRAGANGTALSFCDQEEKAYLKDIEKLIGKKIPLAENHPYPLSEEPLVILPKVQNTVHARPVANKAKKVVWQKARLKNNRQFRQQFSLKLGIDLFNRLPKFFHDLAPFQFHGGSQFPCVDCPFLRLPSEISLLARVVQIVHYTYLILFRINF